MCTFGVLFRGGQGLSRCNFVLSNQKDFSTNEISAVPINLTV